MFKSGVQFNSPYFLADAKECIELDTKTSMDSFRNRECRRRIAQLISVSQKRLYRNQLR